MKKIILSFIVLLSVGSAYGQTAEKLMAKYKALEGAQYENTTEESRKSIEENKASLSQKDYVYALKHFKKSEQVQLTLDDDQKKQLEKDLQSLRSYEMLFMLNDNKEPEDGKNILQNMINQTFSPDYQFRVYGKLKGDVVKDMLIRFDMWGKVVLLHHVGKIKKDFILKGLYNDNMVQVEEDVDAVDMKEIVKEVEKGNALFVINGKEIPELRSFEEAKEYMEKNNFHFNHESWVVGGAVKEKYPNTDKKVVIEFSRQEKEKK